MFTVDIDRSTIGDNYLKAFPLGSDPVYIERTEHDCQTCRQFIKFIGTAVTINSDGSLDTIWDVDGLVEPYVTVAATLSAQVKSASIKSIFLHNEPKAGSQLTQQILTDSSVKNWDHFWAVIPDHLYERDIATKKGMSESRAGVHKRSLETISIDTLLIVQDLIQSDSIYRGAEHLAKLNSFITMKNAFESVDNQDSYAWLTYNKSGAGIRNTVIGSLLIDIEEGKDIETAVKSFESKVAPSSYKRPKAVVTKRMMENAIKQIDELGIRDSLNRRQALPTDVSVNDVIFADRGIKLSDQDPLMAMFDEIPTEIKGLDNATEITMDRFISDIVPNSTKLSLIVGKAQSANQIQISAPEDDSAPNILQWDNNFAWAYNGNVTDSDIATKVKAAGGKVDGFLRFSIQWNENGKCSSNDLDAHCTTPNKHIYYGKKEADGGSLDVDITNPGNDVAVENITWADQGSIPNGKYRFYVNNYSGRNIGGFRAEIAIGDELYNYDISDDVTSDITVAIVSVNDGEFSIEHNYPHTMSTATSIVPVKMMMLSPNHWGDSEQGNKHFIFITEPAEEQQPFRGLFNEYLSPTLYEHRKVFDMLASKMMCEPVVNGLSGYGFSSTRRTSVYVKADNRLYKVLV
jgi:hypothetical protein